MKEKGLKEMYIKYKEMVAKPVEKRVHSSVVSLFNKFLCDKILDGDIVTLPCRVGSVDIRGKKQKITFDENGKIRGTKPNWKKTWSLWERNPEAKAVNKFVYHNNFHSDGIWYKFFWSKKRVLIENKSLYSLTIARPLRRAMSRGVFNGKEYLIDR